MLTFSLLSIGIKAPKHWSKAILGPPCFRFIVLHGASDWLIVGDVAE
jgi:hypothetical protein